jgi:hypothetical protein
MIISAYNITEFDFSAIGGPANGYIYDSQFHVVDEIEAELKSIGWFGSVDNYAIVEVVQDDTFIGQITETGIMLP